MSMINQAKGEYSIDTVYCLKFTMKMKNHAVKLTEEWERHT